MEFDQLAARYDTWYRTPLGALVDTVESRAILRLGDGAARAHVLDLGCGTGRYTIELERRGARVVGVDPSWEMLAVAREKLRREGHPVRLVCASAEALPLRAGVFDVVIAVTSLCFVRRPGEAIGEVHRTLRTGGRLVIGELNRSSLWAIWRRLKGLFRDTVYKQAHVWRRAELSRLLEGCGFRVRTVETFVHFPPIPAGVLVKLYPLVEWVGARVRSGWGAFIAINAERM